MLLLNPFSIYLFPHYQCIFKIYEDSNALWVYHCCNAPRDKTQNSLKSQCRCNQIVLYVSVIWIRKKRIIGEIQISITKDKVGRQTNWSVLFNILWLQRSNFRFIVVCLLLKKMKLVRDLVRELSKQIGHTYFLSNIIINCQRFAPNANGLMVRFQMSTRPHMNLKTSWSGALCLAK